MKKVSLEIPEAQFVPQASSLVLLSDFDETKCCVINDSVLYPNSTSLSLGKGLEFD